MSTQPDDVAGGRTRPGAATAPAGSTEPAAATATESEEDAGTDALTQSARASGEGAEQEAGSAARILPDVVALTSERDEYLQALQRMKADFDNYRKRIARFQEEQSARAATDLVGKLLPVLDNLDLAQAHLGAHPGSEEARALAQVRSQLLDILAKEGLDRVDAAGVPFDPAVHDAVAHAPADAGDGNEIGNENGNENENGGAPSAPEAPQASPGVPAPASASHDNGAASTRAGQETVDEVMRAGYRWRGQVLRPAMVRVRG